MADRTRAIDARGVSESGLVSYATFPPKSSEAPADDRVRRYFRFPSAEMIDAAASMFPPARSAAGTRFRNRVDVQWEDGRVCGSRVSPVGEEYRDLFEGQWPRLIIAPGMVRFARQDDVRAERAAVAAADRESAEAVAYRRDHYAWHYAPMVFLEDYQLLSIDRTRFISAWSRKSRSSLRRMIASLDLTVLLESERIPGMLTLTLPDGWLYVAPDAATMARKFDRFVENYRKKWGALACIWKREFQKRGAPHYHLWFVPPVDEAGMPDFLEWLAVTWTRILFKGTKFEFPDGHAPDWRDDNGRRACRCSDYCKSLVAGTGVDFVAALRARDPNRLSEYFLKEAGYSEAKAYQNSAPRQWQGQSIGRFWGVRNIPTAVAEIALRPEDQYEMWRVLRHVRESRSKYLVRRSVPRGADLRTGELRYRWMGRRARVTSAAGWVAVNNGAALGATLGRYATSLVPDERRCSALNYGLAHVCASADRRACLALRKSIFAKSQYL
jgi:hypothetical protein